MNINKRKKGKIYEDRSCDFLVSKGFEILERNYQNKFGEIDIIVKKDNLVVFVEVKYRKEINYGNGIEAIDKAKSKKMFSVAVEYIYKNSLFNSTIRFDCIIYLGDEITWVENIIWGDEIGF